MVFLNFRRKKRVLQVRFGDGKVKTILGMTQDPNTRSVELYLRKFPWGAEKIIIPTSQIFGWNQMALIAGKYCLDCPLYSSIGEKIKTDINHPMLEMAVKINFLEKELNERDDMILSQQYELSQQRGTTDEAVAKRITEIGKLSEASVKGQGKKMIQPQNYPYNDPLNLPRQEDQG